MSSNGAPSSTGPSCLEVSDCRGPWNWHDRCWSRLWFENELKVRRCRNLPCIHICILIYMCVIWIDDDIHQISMYFWHHMNFNRSFTNSWCNHDWPSVHAAASRSHFSGTFHGATQSVRQQVVGPRGPQTIAKLVQITAISLWFLIVTTCYN